MEAAVLDRQFLEIKAEMLGKLDLKVDMADDEVRDIIEDIVQRRAGAHYINIAARTALTERVFNALRRLDVLQPLIDDADTTEIMVNGRSDIFIERNGKMFRTGSEFETVEKLEDVIQSIVSKVNRTVNEASPIVDARLADGSRVNVVLPPIAIDGPVVTIRKFPDKPMSIERLLMFGSLDEKIAELLNTLIRAKYNIFISGGTGSGKTSLLNAVAALIPDGERVITIEDAAELQLKSLSNLVRLETRNANTEGKGQVGMGSLIKSSLRMRPDRIIVGEVRDGQAAYYMLQSMNTGHDGSLTTGHANSARDMLSRLETMVLSEESIPLEAIRRQIAAAIDIIIHVSRIRDGSRKIVEISELDGLSDGEIVLNRLFEFRESDSYFGVRNAGENGTGIVSGGGDGGDVVCGEFQYSGNRVRNSMKLRLAGLKSEYFE